MKIKIYFLILLFSLFTTTSFSKSKCTLFYDELKNSYDKLDLSQDQIFTETGFGFDIQVYLDEKITRIFNSGDSIYQKDESAPLKQVKLANIKLIKNEKKPIIFQAGGDWEIDKSEKGYYKVGKIYSSKLAGKIKPNDLIISIDGKDIREFDLTRKKNLKEIKYIEDFFKDREGEELKVVFESYDKFGQKYNQTLETKIYERKYVSSYLDFYLNSVFIDELNGTTNISITTEFDVYRDNKFPIIKVAREMLRFIDDDGNEKFYQCPYSAKKWDELDMIKPDQGVIFNNLVYKDQSLFEENYLIENYFEDVSFDSTDDQLGIRYISKGEYKFKNNFNLRSFPFDKQKITVYAYQKDMPLGQYQASVSDYAKRAFKSFSKNINSISGWNISNNSISYKTKKDIHSEDFYDGVELTLTIERKSSYYIFKVIFPIILILMICWSAVWIDPKEIESRLTITIVCLLSLIAYNFVIDSELPKLEYLTIMDYIILISYIYAAIPNFLSIYSFELIKKNKALAEKYEAYEKRYGLPSYILIIFVIIIINTSSAPEHTNSMFSWATMRN